MATHSSTLAWKIPRTEDPGGLQSMGSQRVGHDCATLLLLFSFMHWRRIWQPTPVFLPGESQGWGSLVDCCLWGRTESDTTEVTQQQQQQKCAYMSATLSIRLTLPSPHCVLKSVSISASLFLPCKQVHQYHSYRFHIYVLIYICFSLSDFTLFNRLQVHPAHYN